MTAPRPTSRTRTARQLLRVLRPFTRPGRRYVAVILVTLLLGLPLAWITPFLIQQVFDRAVPLQDTAELWRLGGKLALITFLGAILALVRGVCTTLFHNKSLHRLRLRLFHVYQSLGMGWVQDRETGELMSRLSDDVGNLGGVMADSFAAAVSALVQAIVVSLILFSREWRLAAFAVAGAVVLIGIHLAFNRPLRARSHLVRERATDLTSGMHQAITGHQLVRAAAAERSEARRFAGLLAGSVRASISRDLFGLYSGHPTVVLGGLLPLAMLLLAGHFMAGGSLTQGGMLAFFILLGQLFDAAGTLGRLNPAFQSSLASLDRIADVLDARTEHRQPTGTFVPDTLRGEVTFESVSFRYRSTSPGELVLKDISFAIPSGTTVALVGRSGAGKSTLLSLIPRFFEPTGGRILIDGRPLADFDVAALRRHIGVVPQDVFLFDRTIGENIAFGRPDASPADIRAAADAACCTEFIAALPAGFDTRTGERGVKLSGGQRQRIAIAREILRDPRIIILDEATSSLDSETERDVQTALRRLLAGRTAFIIAHRLSTVREVDRILVLEDGAIVGSGTHATLIESNEPYRRLALVQNFGAPTPHESPWTSAS